MSKRRVTTWPASDGLPPTSMRTPKRSLEVQPVDEDELDALVSDTSRPTTATRRARWPLASASAARRLERLSDPDASNLF